VFSIKFGFCVNYYFLLFKTFGCNSYAKGIRKHGTLATSADKAATLIMDGMANFIIMETECSIVPGPVPRTNRCGFEVCVIISVWLAICFKIIHIGSSGLVLIQIVKQDIEIYLTMQHLSKFQRIKQPVKMLYCLLLLALRKMNISAGSANLDFVKIKIRVDLFRGNR
jgi:hypothetical protein